MIRPSIPASLIACGFAAAVASAVLFPVLGSPLSFLVGALFGAAAFPLHRGFGTPLRFRPTRRSWTVPRVLHPAQLRRRDEG
jgi:hypothetical protein